MSVYRAALIEPTRRFKGSAGLGQLVDLRVYTVTTRVGGQKGRNCAAAVRGHCLTKPLLGERKIALLEGVDSREESRYRPVGQRLRVGREPRRLGVLQCPHQLRAVEAGLRPKDEAAEKPVELAQGLAGSDAPQRALDALGIVGAELGIGRCQHAAQKRLDVAQRVPLE